MGREYKARRNAEPSINVVQATKTRLAKALLWMGGILLGVMASYATAVVSGMMNPVLSPLMSRANETLCSMFSPPPKNTGNDFLILISPLSGDEKGAQTRQLINSFHGSGVNAYLMCKSVSFDTAKDIRSADAEVKKTGSELLQKYDADLLIFGDVTQANTSTKLWMVNEFGGCDLRPVPVILDHGLMPPSSGMQKEISSKVIANAVAQIMSACNHSETANWQALASRARKLQYFLQTDATSLNQTDVERISQHYADALGLLYLYQKDEQWFRTASAFSLNKINTVHAGDPPKKAIWLAGLGGLYEKRWRVRGEKPDLQTALDITSQAIQLSPAAVRYEYRANIAREAGAFSSAIADYSESIRLEPKRADTYIDRGRIWYIAGRSDKAIDDYETALRMNSGNARAIVNRAIARFGLGEFDAASADFGAYLKAGSGSLTTQLWHQTSRLRAGAVLDSVKLTHQDDKWPAPLADLFQGKTTPDAVISVVERKNSELDRDDKCTAYFFVGEHYLLRKQIKPAKTMLQQAKTVCPVGSNVLRTAVLELERIS